MENNEKKLIDPITFDTDEDYEHKKKIWNDIFLRCPDFSNALISVYEESGPNGVNSIGDDYAKYAQIYCIVNDVEEDEEEEEEENSDHGNRDWDC